jgi:hypothetical protein
MAEKYSLDDIKEMIENEINYRERLRTNKEYEQKTQQYNLLFAFMLGMATTSLFMVMLNAAGLI